MSKKLFVVSDIHGHYTELTEALRNVGFDADNDDHIFLSCGDLFDRGMENIRVYDFVRGLRHKILLKGNHEDMLCDIFRRGSISVTNIRNGTDITVEQFLGKGAIDANGEFDPTAHTEKIGEITAFVDSMINYYETDKYIFTHGWVPSDIDGRYASVMDDWRNASYEDWRHARWIGWHEMYNVGAMIKGKTIVCGHRTASLGSMFDSFRASDCYEPFYGNGVIAIDALTVRSHRVNVLVIDESDW